MNFFQLMSVANVIAALVMIFLCARAMFKSECCTHNSVLTTVIVLGIAILAVHASDLLPMTAEFKAVYSYTDRVIEFMSIIALLRVLKVSKWV